MNYCKLDKYKSEIIKLYTSGIGIKQLGNIYNRHLWSIREFLKKNNFLFPKRKYKLNENYFDKIDTEDKAYFLGLLYADGNHNLKRFVISIGLDKKDIDILEKFNIYLNNSKPIFISKRGMCVIELSSKQISKMCLQYGMIPQKTFKLQFPEWLDKTLYNHFIRGYFDGDGSIGFYKTKNKKASLNFKSARFSLVSTDNFLDKIQDILNNELNIRKRKLKTRFPERLNNTRILDLGGNKQVKKIMDYLYKNATVYLDRKFKKYKEFYYGK